MRNCKFSVSFITLCKPRTSRKFFLFLFSFVLLCLLIINLIQNDVEEFETDSSRNVLFWFKENRNIMDYVKINKKTCIVCLNSSKFKSIIATGTGSDKNKTLNTQEFFNINIGNNSNQTEINYDSIITDKTDKFIVREIKQEKAIQNKYILLSVFVASAPEHEFRRIVIRRTWGKVLRPPPIFITGFSKDPKIMTNLLKEANLFKDLIIENFEDTYYNLTLKTAFIFKNFLTYHKNCAYLMKIDDDMFMNPDLINEIIINELLSNGGGINNDNLPIIGKVFDNAHPYRHPGSKWYIPRSLYENSSYPSYTSGTAYLIPNTHVEKLLKVSLKQRMFPYEDVFFTGIIREKENVSIKSHEGFKLNVPTFNYHCFLRNSAVIHGALPNLLEKMWTSLELNFAENCPRWLMLLLNIYY